MTTLASPKTPAFTGPSASPSAAELAELMAAFNDVTARLEDTHTALRHEVARLNAELYDTRSQLARAQELAALGEMAAGIAHEVRNPLGSIRLYAEALAHDLEDKPNEQQVASRIVSSVTQLNAVVGDVLTFARELRIEPEPTDAQLLIHQTIEACQPTADERRVTLETSNSTAAIILHADAGLLRQALINVVRNAIEAAALTTATAEHPAVAITATEDTLRDSDGTRITAHAIAVTDNGPGFPPDARKRAFNPFFTTRETGTGLGLAIVHRILDAHQGRVAIANNNPRGATVTLTIPDHTNTQPSTHPHNQQGAQG